MAYLDEHLSAGESVVYRTKLHKLYLTPSALCVLLGVVMLAADLTAGAIVLLVSFCFFAVRYAEYATNEYGVTTQRVVIKLGWLNVRTVEVQLNKVEALSVSQTYTGRMYDFGTLVVGGSGGTKEAFTFIAGPIAFRKAVHAQVAIQEQSVRGASAPANAYPSVQLSSQRVERDCPYCAERILVAAKVCKHCNREVGAAV